MRSGDFSGQAALKNPYTGFNPYSGNTILPQYLSPQAKQAQQIFFPLPNFGPPTLTAANYRASFDGPEVHRTEEFRVDHNFTANHMAFVRYSNRKDDYHIPGARSSASAHHRGHQRQHPPREFLDPGRCGQSAPQRGQRISRRRRDPGLGQQRGFHRPEPHAADRHRRPAGPRRRQQSPVLQRLRLHQQQHQPVEPGERRARAVGRQPELGSRPPLHEVRRGSHRLVCQSLHAQQLRQSHLRQLLFYRGIHRQRLRRFPAGTAGHRDPRRALPGAVQPLARLVRLRAGRFQNDRPG